MIRDETNGKQYLCTFHDAHNCLKKKKTSKVNFLQSSSNKMSVLQFLPTSKNKTGVTLPIPHAYFKSVLTERNTGAFNMWSFIIKNEESNEPLESFRVPTSKVEKISGLYIWETLVGSSMTREKNKVRGMWKY